MLAGRPTFTDDDPSARLTWLRAHLHTIERVPHPGSGLTVVRWRALAELAAADGSLARLVEGHLDALAISDELGRPAEGDGLRGVWAARPDQLRAEPAEGGWRLTGRKPWCSGAGALDRALVTATDPDGAVRLFDVAVDGLTFADDWRAIGMRASDSRTADIDLRVGAEAELGPPGAYVERAGFWHGGVGVAACWHGLAWRIATDLGEHAAERDDPYVRATSGRAIAAVTASTAFLAAAGRQIDDRPGDVAAARRRAFAVRVGVEQIARSIVEASLAAQGASAICFDDRHGRAVADLLVYLGQLHPGADAAEVRDDPGADWWSS